MSRSVLMVAFHYPPCFGSSGVHRTLSFSRYLPERGWRPIVLTASVRAYPQINSDQMSSIPTSATVRRAFALDSTRHFSLGGRYLRASALPDRWVTWLLGAVPAGVRLARRFQPELIWSTYPIATAHLIAFVLHRLTRIPWVADFRDPMSEDDFPRDVTTRRVNRWIESQAARFASLLVFTTDSARTMCLRRYPRLRPEQCLVIANGYEEADFQALGESPRLSEASARVFRLVHSGLIYPEDRDPRPLFRALATLKRKGVVDRGTFQVALRASGYEDYYGALVKDHDLADMVQLLPPLPYHQALAECARASGLLLLQGPSCNAQVPAKAYEYLRVGKPIFALTPTNSDTGTLLARCGGATLVDPLDEKAIAAALPEFFESVGRGAHATPDPVVVARYARHNTAAELAEAFSSLIGAAIPLTSSAGAETRRSR
jgi:glycosyltransferase involved in cell wall biosynthesis